MRKILTTILLTLFVLSATSYAKDTLMHQSHEKLRQAQQEMQIIKKTEDPVVRKQLLDKHLKTMQEFNDIMLQVQHDPKRGEESVIMGEVMFERIQYLEQMMQQLLENQSERVKLEDAQ